MRVTDSCRGDLSLCYCPLSCGWLCSSFRISLSVFYECGRERFGLERRNQVKRKKRAALTFAVYLTIEPKYSIIAGKYTPTLRSIILPGCNLSSTSDTKHLALLGHFCHSCLPFTACGRRACFLPRRPTHPIHSIGRDNKNNAKYP